jgi:hypothetical protein
LGPMSTSSSPCVRYAADFGSLHRRGDLLMNGLHDLGGRTGRRRDTEPAHGAEVDPLLFKERPHTARPLFAFAPERQRAAPQRLLSMTAAL